MSAGSIARNVLRSIFSWKMLFMLIGSTLVFGGVLYLSGLLFMFFPSLAPTDGQMSMPVPVINVTATTAETQDWGVEVAAIGVLEARRGVDVNSSVPGLIQQIKFESGQKVSQGQPLVQLDADVERSNLAKAQAALKLAKADLARGESLLTTNNISKATLDQRQSEYEVAAAEVASLGAQIGKKSIEAPFDGVLGIRKVNVGQYLETGTAIVNIQDMSVMFVNFSISQRELSDLKVGQKIRMTTDAYPVKEFGGEISAIEPLINQQTGMVEVQGSFDNADGLLRPGMFAKLAIILPARMEVIVVPQTAISYSLYGDYLYVVNSGKSDTGEDIRTVERKIVKTGERRNGFVIVESGIEPGEEIVTSGQLKLDNGTRVAVQDEETLKLPEQVPVE